MIEDDLRTIISDAVGVDVYARLVPPLVTECVSVQAAGGSAVAAGIHKARYTVTILGVSEDRDTARSYVRTARDYLVRHLPQDVDGTHYYLARPLDSGAVRTVPPNRTSVEYAGLEVLASL